MMNPEAHQKVNAGHLKRKAYLYVRQSTPRQVLENTESTQRQYALRQRAVALGWPQEQIVVIDSDMGHSAASTADREGFQKLVTEVSMGKVGIVLGLEVSRLARNNADWHRLLEICALTETLILDEDGVYDPAHFNDRLLLGLKGTMSEAELHVLQARLRGGALNKARRGELGIPLPIGFVYNEAGEVVVDPDEQVRESVRLLFATFRRVGSASGTVREFIAQGWKFPQRPLYGPRQGQLVWGELECARASYVLRNPRYTGAYVYGRQRSRKKADGIGYLSRTVPRDQWLVLIRDAHPGYISWEEYEENMQRLRQNARRNEEYQAGPVREGPALLQGIVLCGRCGERMTVRYHTHGKESLQDYVCLAPNARRGEPVCQHVPGKRIDEAIGNLLLEAVTPMALEVALTVQQEIEGRVEEGDRLRRIQVERARYDAGLAQRRYMKVDPDNRLVADALEADWNQKLRALAEAEEQYAQRRQNDQKTVSPEERARILALATDFPRLWRDPNTPNRERKRMVRLMLEDVTLLRGDQVTVQVRFKGGATRTFQVGLRARVTDPAVIAEIDRLLNQHTRGEIAAVLNERNIRTVDGNRFTIARVGLIERRYHLKSRYDRLREAGLLTRSEMAELLGLAQKTVVRLHADGRLRGQSCDDRSHYLYEAPERAPARTALHAARKNLKYEVQYEA